MFFLTGIYLFYLGLVKPLYLILSGIVLAIALPAYHSERLLVPLTILYFGFRFGRKLFKKPLLTPTLIAIFFGVLISLPTLLIINTPGFLSALILLVPGL